MDLPPPPQADDPIITQFKPVRHQWELNDENIKRIDPKTGQTILHNYCERINTTPLEVYRYLIETLGCDVNAQDGSDYTPIHRAFDYFDPSDGGDIAVLAYLINQKGIIANIKGGDGKTLLHWACKRIHKFPLDLFKFLIETMGFDVNVQDNSNNTPLHYAFEYSAPLKDDNINVLTDLFNQKNVDANIKGGYGYSLLHVACDHINKFPLDLFKFLIETMGYDVNAQGNYKDSPLHIALRYFDPNDGGDISVLQYLFNQKGINVNIKNSNRYTLLHYACININKLPIEIFKLLIETLGCDVNAQDDGNETPIHRGLCCFNPRNGGDISVLQYLLNQTKVHVNTKSKRGGTILHYACININKLPLEIFKFLIEKMGCDVNVQNNDKDTPLHNALCYFDPNDGGDITVLTYLLSQKGIDVNIRDQNGCNLLDRAYNKINALSIEIFKLLIETIGFDANVQDNNKNTPIHRGLCNFNPNKGGDISVLQYLFNQTEVHVNTQGKYGSTILHYACDMINYCPLDAFKFLIETQGYDVNAQNNDNDTPLHNAFRCFSPRSSDDINVLYYLINQKNIDANIKGKDGYTILHYACDMINNLPLDIFKLLTETIGFDVNVQAENKDTPLHSALRLFNRNQGDVTVLTYLINQKDVDVNIRGKQGHSFLHLACISNLPHSGRSKKPNAKVDSNLCRIVEAIAERCVQQVLDELTL
jgi:ankyrin repeat protein